MTVKKSVQDIQNGSRNGVNQEASKSSYTSYFNFFFSKLFQPEKPIVGNAEVCETSTLTMHTVDSLPPPLPENAGKLTVVLDLDETLVYAREGNILPRPYLNELLQILSNRCEVIIWTAGVKCYAHRVLTAIDKNGVLKNCICRPECCHEYSAVKELSRLRRDVSRTVIIENTPDCVVRNPLNSVIVSDYVQENESDITLSVVAKILDGLIDSGDPVPEYLACNEYVRMQTLRNAAGDTLSVFVLNS